MRKMTYSSLVALSVLFAGWIAGGCSSTPETDAERQARMADANLVIEIPKYTINYEREGGGNK